MGIPCRVSINEGEIGYRCKQCATPVSCKCDHVKGANFHGKFGAAIFMYQVWNIQCDPPEEQNMQTGRYTIQTVNCSTCRTYLGWNYLHAHERLERYKEGRFCIESAQVECADIDMDSDESSIDDEY